MNNIDLTDNISRKIAQVRIWAEMVPGVIIIHNISNLKVEYMSPGGLKALGISLRELQDMGAEYHNRFFNSHDAKDYVPKIMGLVRDNDDESISFFQQVRTGENRTWKWHFSSMKILMRDDLNNPVLTITTSFQVDPLNHVTTKVARLLDENSFLRENYQTFAKLGKREQEILRLVAMGKHTGEISGQLFISPATVETHRKNIRHKLNITSSYEISLYARAFDLI
ncbi:MAG TPA: helix-turn-helix transcriptional regulator [Daejeonella sp.]|nr:helix-turn-helix transcriptional regulator [Daejeonella sp.]